VASAGAAALGFGGLLLVQVAYVGCGGLQGDCRGETHDARNAPVTERKYAKDNFTNWAGERPRFIQMNCQNRTA